jgi:hypothetical protein
MPTITFTQCIEGAWRDAWGFAWRHPLFIVACFAGIYFIGIVQNDIHRPYPPSGLLALAALWLLRALLMSAVAVQTLRYVLLGDEAVAHTFSGRAYWRYCGLTYGLAIGMVLAAGVVALLVGIAFRAAGVHAHERATFAVVACVIVMLMVWVHLRLSLLPSHIAIGRPLLWRAAWRDTRGNGWSIAVTYLAIGLTLAGVGLVVGVIGAAFGVALGEGVHGSISIFTRSILLVPAMSVSSAASAWIYRRYAAELFAQPRDV